MSLAIVHTRTPAGIHALPVTVEVHLSAGLPKLSIVGLPETAVKESKDRVRSAILNSQFEFPNRRITINLAPADLPKEGGCFDLPIAIGILAATGQIPKDKLSEYEFTGELALSGKLRKVSSILPCALATQKSQRKLILPIENADEAALVKNLQLHPASHLLSVCAHLTGKEFLPLHQRTLINYHQAELPDFCDVKGQLQGKRVMEIAAAGGHNVLLVGPPGTGKTMLANRLPSILPPLTQEQAIEVASIYSICELKDRTEQFFQAPFRHPHHTTSAIALIGGGNIPMPGEVSLAHQGVLFLDEFSEFDRRVLEVLREPMEAGYVSISRVKAHMQFPAKFQLIAAMNPCPCGYLGSANHNCECLPSSLQRYRNKLSGPLLDRIDLHTEIPQLPQEFFSQSQQAESSETIRARVIKAHQRQFTRQGRLNASLQGKALEKHCHLAQTECRLLEMAMTKLKISARAYHRILKVARTIADLEGHDHIQTNDLTEALSYRKL